MKRVAPPPLTPVQPVYPKVRDDNDPSLVDAMPQAPGELIDSTVSLAPGALASMNKAGWPGAHVQPDPPATLETPTDMPTPPTAFNYSTFLAAVASKLQELGWDAEVPAHRHQAVIATIAESPDLARGLSADDIIAAAQVRAVGPIVGRKAEVVVPERVKSSESEFDAFSGDPATVYQRFTEWTKTPVVDNYSAYRAAAKASCAFTSAGLSGDVSAYKPGLYARADIALAEELGDDVKGGERKWFDRYHEIAKSHSLRLSEATDRGAAARQVALERIASGGASVGSARTFAEAVLIYRAKNALTFREGDSRQAHAAVARMRPDLVSYAPSPDVMQCSEPFDVAALFREAMAARNLPDTNASRRIVADDVAARMKATHGK